MSRCHLVSICGSPHNERCWILIYRYPELRKILILYIIFSRPWSYPRYLDTTVGLQLSDSVDTFKKYPKAAVYSRT